MANEWFASPATDSGVMPSDAVGFATEKEARRYGWAQQNADGREWFVGQRVASFKSFAEAFANVEFMNGPQGGRLQ